MNLSEQISYASSTLELVKPSASAWVSQSAKKLRSQGKDVIDLGLGEPDFDTPSHIIDAAHQAALNGQTRYPPTDGTSELKQAVVGKLKRENGVQFESPEVIVSNGAKQVIFNALMATLNPGDEVLLCAPYFGQYKDMVVILGAKPIEVECKAENRFLMTPDSLESAIGERTRWLILNSPSNPCGATYTRSELEELGRVLSQHRNVLVLADEIYEHIVFDDFKFVSFGLACPELRPRTLIVNGVSKAYAMTGWRIGYGAGPQALISAMTKVQSQISSGACSVAQAAAAAALNGPQDSVTLFRKSFEARRNAVVERVALIEGLSLDKPHGAFYAYIDCADCIGRKTPSGQSIESDTDFTQYLLEDALVAAVPGSAYGLSPFFRISTATSEEVLMSALDRIESSVKKLFN
ncbi:pyridoxal phosphate-dependent aminotransferase [Arenicella sp. 4NH20-0111]|uniref:pyridoxal phosphate-dependent aminotransferase n=1 Tax=Arenicella sp. 4NH20-0111 TaxID=3127648 RepID=UPI003101BBD2